MNEVLENYLQEKREKSTYAIETCGNTTRTKTLIIHQQPAK
jgi:hypothetical protein